ncbi:hypothetical protein QSH57_011860 [Fusarium oxysporum f. sp. vasinfectum]|nr:hypothetical protein QSH57_011860 [Fusarium oxysporum f. sp. vasinfectum]
MPDLSIPVSLSSTGSTRHNTRFKDLYDSIILPAIFETVPDHIQQEMPSSYDLLYAKSRAYQEKPGASR